MKKIDFDFFNSCCSPSGTRHEGKELHGSAIQAIPFVVGIVKILVYLYENR